MNKGKPALCGCGKLGRWLDEVQIRCDVCVPLSVEQLVVGPVTDDDVAELLVLYVAVKDVPS